MTQALVLSSAADGAALPALALLPHTVRHAPAHASSLANIGAADVIIVDARSELTEARALCRVIHTAVAGVPVLVVVSEAGLAAVGADWAADDIVLSTATPGEVDLRLRLLVSRADEEREPSRFTAAGVTIDESSYIAKAHGRTLDLTYKEFELLRFLAAHTDRVFT
ncbi:MAG TPA: DNA-binding response regulator, partial [Terrimesophilobacter sp.]|nr:DNA-binding response regulator [Terrimesophilobacter sp.]